MIKLYHYPHCPFCVRVRLALGFLKLKYESIVLEYNDESTPVTLSGKKMLPIIKINNKEVFNESLEIISNLDTSNRLKTGQEGDINGLLSEIGKSVHPLCMPYWVWTPEFSSASRKYFQDKKYMKYGNFNLLAQNAHKYMDNLNKTLECLEKELSPFYQSNQLGIKDIMLASHLWGMYIYPEFQFSNKVHSYLQEIKALCSFNYHVDFWQGPREA